MTIMQNIQRELSGLFVDRKRPARAPIQTVNFRRVETERLILRVPEMGDYRDYCALLADPEAFRFSERGPMSGEEVWTRLLRQVGHWSLAGYGLFAVQEKATGCIVGEVGFGDFRRGLGPRFDSAPEGGWTIAAGARGHGYATEAAEAALAWLDVRLGSRRTVCMIHTQNKASLRVAHKLGFRAFSEIDYRGYRAMLLERHGGNGEASAD